jgi:hypothetical protein
VHAQIQQTKKEFGSHFVHSEHDFIMSMPEHGECDGFEGGCAVQ